MELLITIAYIFLVRLIFFDYKLLKYTLFWKFVTFGLWVAAAMTEIIFLGQYAPYSKAMFVQSYVVQMAPEFGGLVTEVYVTQNQPVKKGELLFQMDPSPWQYRVDRLEAQLAAADAEVCRAQSATRRGPGGGEERGAPNLAVTREQVPDRLKPRRKRMRCRGCGWNKSKRICRCWRPTWKAHRQQSGPPRSRSIPSAVTSIPPWRKYWPS